MEALASVILEQFASLEGLSSVYSFNGEVSKLQTTMKNIVAVINEAEERQLKESAVKRWLDQLKEVIYELDDLLDEWNTAITKSIIEDEWNTVIIKSMHEEEEAAAAPENIEKSKVYKIGMHHDGSLHKIRQIISKFKGVETVDTNVPKNEITVKGSMDVNEFTRYLNEKLKTSVVPKKEEDGGYKKDNEGSGSGAGSKKQKEGGGVDKEVIVQVQKRQVKDHAEKLQLDHLNHEANEVTLLDECNTEMIKSKVEEEAENTPLLKEKVNKLSLPLGFGNKIKELRRKLDVIVEGRLTFGFESTFGLVRNKEVEQPPSTAFVDVFDICGRDEHKDNLVSNLLGTGSQEERSPHVISLVGIGGIGKTTLARLAFNDDEVKAHFERRMWVCVSEHFDEIRVAKEIIENLEGDSSNVTNSSRLFQRIVGLMGGKKFFLVLDDVWTEDWTKWEPFRIALKYGSHGSRILVTTRKNEVAKMMGSVYTINLNVLSWEDCWSVFSKIAFFEMDSKQRQLLEDLGREISKKCKGFPLAAKVLGSFLRFKKSREDWKNVLGSNLWEFDDVESCMFAPLLLSYNDLSPVLRLCFSYCAVFPKDTIILVKDLIQLWVAQNYIGARGSMEMERLGQQYFENLAMRSFFQDFERNKDDGRIISCKMHDIVHDFVRLQMNNDCFSILVDGKESMIGYFYESTRHLSIEFARQTQFPTSVCNARNLRTLLTSNTRHVSIKTILPTLFQHLTCLRALNLNSSSIDKLPDEIENLIHLRFLDLSSNYEIEELPETMCNLCNLQTLDVSGCYLLEKLPLGMGKLINLRHFILDGADFVKMFPKGFGRLNSLRTLSKFIVSDNDESTGCKLEELKNMNHLEGALEIKGLGNVINVIEAKKALLEKKIHLHRLCLDFNREGEKITKMENDQLVLDALKPHPYLEHLEISGTIKFPKWMMSLTKLKNLKLSRFWKSDPFPPLGKLPLLESLEILDFDGVKKVGVEFLGIESNDQKDVGLSTVDLFPNLKYLKFQEMRDWEEWDSNGGMRENEGEVIIMPHLRSLNIMYCPKLKTLPEFLETIELEELSIEYCSQISNYKMLLTRLKVLKVLVLKQCKNLEHLPSFGKLPFLELLSLWSVDSVKKVGVEFLGIESDYKKEKGLTSSLTFFPELRSLEFWSFGEWEEWDGIGEIRKEDNVVVMPNLRSLIIYNCPKLNSLPNFLQTTPLKNLRITGSPILRKSCQRKIGYNWENISHIPNIEIND